MQVKIKINGKIYHKDVEPTGRARSQVAYDPKTNRWSQLPPAPILGRMDPAAVWTGRELLVWGGGDSYPAFADGAAFRPKGP